MLYIITLYMILIIELSSILSSSSANTDIKLAWLVGLCWSERVNLDALLDY